jgi:hypothetical protein
MLLQILNFIGYSNEGWQFGFGPYCPVTTVMFLCGLRNFILVTVFLKHGAEIG